MKIDCLLGTYGRYSLVCEALACFLEQTALSQSTLLIYNQHPVPLHFEHPRVRVVNEIEPPRPLRYLRQRMLELADPFADLIHFLEDDDLYLPWHLEDCLGHIGDNVAWKPATSWISLGNVEFSRTKNYFEGSWIFKADYLRSAPVDTHPTYIDHPVHKLTWDARLLATTELEGRTSYIYRWATGTNHLSGYGGVADLETQRANAVAWQSRNNDVCATGEIIPADLALRWQQYLEGIKNQVTAVEWEHNRKRLRI